MAMYKHSPRLALLAFLFLVPGIRVMSQSNPAADKREYKEYPAWVDMMQDRHANFFEVQRAFYTYWQGRPTHRGDGYKPFRRWENFWQFRINPDGTFPESGYVAKEFNRYAEEHPDSDWIVGGGWSMDAFPGGTGAGRPRASSRSIFPQWRRGRLSAC